MLGLRIADMICPPPAMLRPTPDTAVDPAMPGAAGDLATPASFEWMLLQCDGGRPIHVQARLLFEASTREAGLGFWSEIAVLEVVDGRFVAVLRHRRQLRGLEDWHDAKLCQDPAAVRNVFRQHDPLAVTPVEMLIGASGADVVPDALLQAAFREARLLRASWQALLGAVFGVASP